MPNFRMVAEHCHGESRKTVMVRGPFQEVQVVLNRVLLGFPPGMDAFVWGLGLRVNRGVRDLEVKVCLLVVSNKDF